MIEKRVAVERVQQLVGADREDSDIVLVDGVRVLRGYGAGGTNGGESVLVVEEESVFDIQVLHECGGDVDSVADFVRDVDAAQEEQVLDFISHKHDSQEGCQ